MEKDNEKDVKENGYLLTCCNYWNWLERIEYESQEN